MNLYLVRGEFGYGGGYSLLVCAKTLKKAEKIAEEATKDKRAVFSKYTFYPLWETVEFGEMKEGDFKIIDYYE